LLALVVRVLEPRVWKVPWAVKLGVFVIELYPRSLSKVSM
jgi:hypothetical protein